MSAKSEVPDKPYLLNANGVPFTTDGRVLHLELALGDVANNIVTVGSESRCEILASLLDKHDPTATSNNGNPPPTFTRRSKRGFVTHTGTYNSVPVSIVLINMGYPNMDFLVREIRAVTDGPLRIVRLGSCAGLRSDLPVGTVAVASEGAVLIRQNPDAWGAEVGAETEGVEPFLFHKVVAADEELSGLLLKELKDSLSEENGGGGTGGVAVVGCLNASADSFYSSQGRLDPSFEDRNEDLMQSLLARHPTAGTFEMETFQLLHLARLCRKSTLRASATSIVLANRVADDAIAVERIAEIERKAGQAVLRAITS